MQFSVKQIRLRVGCICSLCWASFQTLVGSEPTQPPVIHGLEVCAVRRVCTQRYVTLQKSPEGRGGAAHSGHSCICTLRFEEMLRSSKHAAWPQLSAPFLNLHLLTQNIQLQHILTGCLTNLTGWRSVSFIF